MYKEVLRSISGAELFPVIAIIIFFVFFVLLLIYVVRMDKKEVDEMAAIPLDTPQKPHFLSLTSNGKAK